MPKQSEKHVSPEAHEQFREIIIGKKTLVLLAGLPGSGKSTFAMTHFPLDAIISTDRIREEFSNNSRNQLVSDAAFTLARKITEERLGRGEIAVIDAQNLSENTRAQFYQVAEATGAKIVAFFLNTSVAESVEQNKKRGKDVGASYIKRRRGVYATARRSLEKNPHVSEVHVVEHDDADTTHIVLPEDDREAWEADQELLKEARVSQAMLGAAETGFISKERLPSEGTKIIEAGSVMFVEASMGDAARDRISENFLSHQIIDAESVARRIHADITDDAVSDVMAFILRQRIHHNLTTVVLYPKEFRGIGGLQRTIGSAEERRSIHIPQIFSDADDMAFVRDVVVQRNAKDDEPLFLVGDVQGCYRAMREFAGRIRKENVSAKEEREDASQRKIVFVGDMADRGPYDAESVIYITALVRSGRAILVKGNHDENLLKGLKGEAISSGETNETVRELRKRLSPGSIQKIIEMLERAPYYEEWKHLVVVHASLPRIPRQGEVVPDWETHSMTHGARSGAFVGGRAEVWKLPNTVAHDPEVLVVGGHTHEEEPMMERISGTAVLDAGVELKGTLWGMYYPELELASAEEPSVIKLYEMLKGEKLPEGENLLLFVEYLRQQGLVEVKRGDGEYAGLTLVTYSGVTELGSLWDQYPVLRNFRGLILDGAGMPVARPFKKTHKTGDEIPLEKLTMVPEKVFEKVNGSMGITYFWGGRWRVATKFSFQNEDYTKPSEEMLAGMDISALDSSKTYLFEIILPNDSHLVDYGGRRELILLNSIDTATGSEASWEEVAGTAKKLGAHTARDMTEEFPGMSIADIYAFAQKEGNLKNLEGLMARYRNEQGEMETVKVKTREYDDKKFVRDRLDWEDIIDAFNVSTMSIPEEAFERLLQYNFDNAFARAALETRVLWIKDEYQKIVSEAREFLFSPLTTAQRVFEEAEPVEGKRRAVEKALRAAVPQLLKLLEGRRGEEGKGEMNAFMGFLRGLIEGGGNPEEKLVKHALAKIRGQIGEETKRRGKNSFLVTPGA